jgi:hypothetical protein
MHTNDQELERVLENPDGLIVSSGLEDIIDMHNLLGSEPDETASVNDDKTCMLHIGQKDYAVKIKKMTRQFSEDSDMFKFVLFVPTLDLEDLIQESYLTLSIDDFTFVQAMKKNITWKGDFLTMTTRRKFNETV